MSSNSIKVLSDITVYNKYARYLDDKQRRETWEEICNRYIGMMIKKYGTNEDVTYWDNNADVETGVYSNITSKIINYSYLLYDKDILMSMRAAQFSGIAIEKNHARIYNCSYLPVDHYKAFSEIMFLLLGGTGVGYSVQKHHIEQLPEIRKPFKEQKFLVGDSIEGWADSIKALMGSYFGIRTTKPRFDYSDIREKGERLITAGGKAPGPDPLRVCHVNIESILNRKEDGQKLTSLEVHDIVCYIADCVLAGGIRRSALISFFSFDDKEVATCKYGNWWEKNPQRGRANNSAVILRSRIKEKEFFDFWQIIKDSNSGEPGIYFTNDPEVLSNPCCFSSDANILTENGYKQIGSLEGVKSKFVNYKGDVVDGEVFCSGEKEVFKVKLTNGGSIKCTNDHVFMLSDGRSLPLSDITRLDRLMPYYKLDNTVNDFVKYGFIQGDGSLGRLNSERHLGLEIYIGEKDLDIAELFGLGVGKNYVRGFNEILESLGFSSNQLPERELPTSINTWSNLDLRMFLKGLWSANGSIIKNNRISFKSTCKNLILQLKDILENLGISSYYTTNKPKEVKFSNGSYLCKESYDLNITRYDSVIQFANLIGFVHKYKQDALVELIKSKGPKIRSVKSLGVQKVYDFSLFDDTHWGVVEGVVAHNCEISLRPFTFCNLNEINAGRIIMDSLDKTNLEGLPWSAIRKDFLNKVQAVSFFATLQAGFTDFHYLRPVWQRNTEKDYLIGVSITGICNGDILELKKRFPDILKEAANLVKQVNEEVSKEIGTIPAARTTTIKPSGNSSCVLGTSSGIHAWHSEYYIRNMQTAVGSDLYNYFVNNHPQLIKIMDYDPNSAVIGIPIQAPNTAVLRENETALEMLERVKIFNTDWVHEGHRRGPNTNNVSATVNIKPDEWEEVGKWMWKNKNYFNGLAVLPYDGGTYKDAPYQECTKEQYEEKLQYLKNIDLTKISELIDNTDLSGEIACGPDGCEIL